MLSYDGYKTGAENALNEARKRLISEPEKFLQSEAMVYAVLALAEAVRGNKNLNVTFV